MPVCRGGEQEFGGILWFDQEGEQSQPSPAVGKQIFGHSLVHLPLRGNSWTLIGGDVVRGPLWINLNAIGPGIWIYDSETDEIVDVTVDEGPLNTVNQKANGRF